MVRTVVENSGDPHLYHIYPDLFPWGKYGSYFEMVQPSVLPHGLELRVGHFGALPNGILGDVVGICYALVAAVNKIVY